MIDVQNQRDERGITIQQTGVNNVCLPFLIAGNEKVQNVLATIKFTVSLSKNLRGTHMSRLMEILNEWTNKPLSLNKVASILHEAEEKLSTNAANIHIKFKYFVERTAPVSKLKSFLDLDCLYGGELINGKIKFILSVKIPFTTLCPCSKTISNFGAHNQRSFCTVNMTFSEDPIINIDEVAKLIESQASSQVYSVLKREDEKFVTEAAYDNPKFVEDILRDVVIAVRSIDNIEWFSVECENFESIHNHNAFARHEEFIKL